jgi:transcriptional regulator with XRE-family HTH domain
MNNEQLPPQEPTTTITQKDLATFAEQAKRFLMNAGFSQRKAEDRIGAARGTLSKCFSGRLKVTLKLLRELAQVAGVGPEAFVQGTGLVRLLFGAPETPESSELAKAKADVDALRTELAAARAALQSARQGPGPWQVT